MQNIIDKSEYVEFQIGRNGSFAIIIASLLKRLNRDNPNKTSLVLVLPYCVKDEESLKNFYSEIIYPINSKAHYKNAITKRNKWLVDNAELIVAYVSRNYGGANFMLTYAKKKNIPIINLFNLKDY